MTASPARPSLSSSKYCPTPRFKHQLTSRFYRYRGVDRSPIARNILTPYWNYVTTLLPMWMAPNLITLLGLLCIVINIITIQLLVPDLVGPGPTWMYWSFVLGLWI